jgi:hypothetical protein
MWTGLLTTAHVQMIMPVPDSLYSGFTHWNLLYTWLWHSYYGISCTIRPMMSWWMELDEWGTILVLILTRAFCRDLLISIVLSPKQRAYFGNCRPQLFAPSSQKALLIRKW